MSPKRPAVEIELGRGKRPKIPNPKYNTTTSPEEIEYAKFLVPTLDDLTLETENRDDEIFEPGKKKEPKVLKKKKIRLQETVLAGERCGLTDCQIMMMYNAGSL